MRNAAANRAETSGLSTDRFEGTEMCFCLERRVQVAASESLVLCFMCFRPCFFNFILLTPSNCICSS